ncbi:alpha-E domain-containing protein [bacterium]|nr:alpha-E domain-containing protein [bacterium]
MLSRIAENFYWIGRYMERANDTMNLLEVTHLAFMEQEGNASVSNMWESLIVVNQGLDFFHKFYAEANEQTVHSFLIFSRENLSSIFSCISTVRDNMRAVRNQISSPLWMIVNEFYLWLKNRNIHEILSFDPSMFYRRVKDFGFAFFGALDNTLMRDEAWQFIHLGRALERALETASLLDLKYHVLLESVDEVGKPVDIHQWQILLRSVDGLEPYLNTYSNRIDPANIAELLILNRRFPKSVLFNLTRIKKLMTEMPHQDQSMAYWLLNQKIIGLLSEIESTSIPVIFEVGYHTYLQSIIEQLLLVHGHFSQTYFGGLEDITGSTE